MRHALQCHPDTPCVAVAAIAAEVTREAAGILVIRYAVRGTADAVVPSRPAPASMRRTDALWRHTCLEAFVRPEGGEAYWEFNLAPTWDWQGYAFDGYRAGRRLAQIAAPVVSSRIAADGWELGAAWQLPDDGPWAVGLAAVIEDSSGAISYWALRHPPGKPDFHHSDAFVVTVTP